MIRNLHIEGFRRFEKFDMSNLGRINLLVGGNNSGKTSVLEAVHILLSRGDIESIRSTTYRRGETLWDESQKGLNELDICHLFYGHEIDAGIKFEITADDGAKQRIAAKIVEWHDDAREGRVKREHYLRAVVGDYESDYLGPLGLELDWGRARRMLLPISRRGGVPLELLQRFLRSQRDYTTVVRLISSASLRADEVVMSVESTLLTPEESTVIDALKIIEPNIERIATKGAVLRRFGYGEERSGIMVKCADSSQPVPIGSMGDGMWRMLGLAVGLVRSGQGTLLIDEIDTGLHYSIMSDMWKLVVKTATRLGVQVFATTHSHDCVNSLASVVRDPDTKETGITIQRLEPGSDRSVAFDKEQIAIAAERGIEVR